MTFSHYLCIVNSITRHIEYLILRHDCVIVPELGAFIAQYSPARIDEINILRATYEAMKHAIEDLHVVPDLLLNDAVTIPDVPIRQLGIVKGDSQSLSIAAASIMAKVTRDRLMLEYAELYPQYGFERNKGYGSEEHRAALKTHGPCPIHRKTFIHAWI